MSTDTPIVHLPWSQWQDITARLEALTWWPIETAPKDGTIILLWVPVYHHSGGEFPHDELRVVPARWGESAWGGHRHWQTCLSEGVGDYSGGSTTESLTLSETGYDAPTHWMPLPPPPAHGGGDAE